MARSPRITEPGLAYHLLNRRVMRLPIFEKNGDYEAFERILALALRRKDAPALLAYCLMPNHWHLVARAGTRTGEEKVSGLNGTAVGFRVFEASRVARRAQTTR